MNALQSLSAACSAILPRLLEHLGYTLASVSIGFLLGLVLGILLTRTPKLSRCILPVLSVLNTIPGIVFIGVLFLYLGRRSATVLIALSVYAMFPVLKNTFTGLNEVDAQYKEAARGCGMDHFQQLVLVELPLAMPTIIGGLRIATVYTVSWTVVASMIGLGGLGDFIYKGVSSNNNALILQGAIPAALLAFVLGTLVDILQRHVVPRGLRKGRDEE
ncbi:ABC transporter permease [Pseudoflavonifractor phocaeensis]|uniref:ABC transporter permease n=1 Tax=Pseudoflavonifractor phocaeensis TaxID=1870988 RepID=UPI001F30FC6D|nr:ABC transporter permease [Pseudoflavonifractor phocaeensis]MCF2662237.1 ABC transporter permease [Pseudoflavonifractor phocaeensis]